VGLDNGVVLAPSAADLVPALFIARRLWRTPEEWPALRDRWAEVEEALVPLDRLWGGDGDLSGLQAILEDSALHAAMAGDDRPAR